LNPGLYLEYIIPLNPISEALYASILFFYVLLVVLGTKYLYGIFISRGFPHNVAVYFNRKVIHILAGGVVALLVPVFFTSPTIPLILALILAFINWIPHRTGKLMHWYQVKDNMYEVNFCIAWGVVLTASWIFMATPLYGLIPILFMSFGDAATGIVRNAMFKKRTKSWWGNLAMFLVCAPLAYYYIGFPGVFIAALASIIEHYEKNPIDDNILITLSTFILLLAFSYTGIISF